MSRHAIPPLPAYIPSLPAYFASLITNTLMRPVRYLTEVEWDYKDEFKANYRGFRVIKANVGDGVTPAQTILYARTVTDPVIIAADKRMIHDILQLREAQLATMENRYTAIENHPMLQDDADPSARKIRIVLLFRQWRHIQTQQDYVQQYRNIQASYRARHPHVAAGVASKYEQETEVLSEKRLYF